MQAEPTEAKPLILPRLGAGIVGAAIVFPWLRLPLILACLAALGNAAWSNIERRSVPDVVPETPPARSRSRTRGNGPDIATDSTEDSFPASDPPSWTPVTGTGTRH